MGYIINIVFTFTKVNNGQTFLKDTHTFKPFGTF